MERKAERVEMKELLQNYPAVKMGQEPRAWKRLRAELYPKPDVVGLSKPSYGWWGIPAVSGLAIMAVALCWYEVTYPFGPNNGPGGAIVPASLHAPASQGDKPVLKDFKDLPGPKTPSPEKSGSSAPRPADES